MEKLLDALKIAREAMKERRSYCEQWEYKYGKEWDNEDGYINDAIKELEENRSIENIESIDSASWDFMSITEMDEGFPERRERIKILIGQRDNKIREECKEMKKLYVKFGNETPPDECLSCSRQCPNGCPLDK